MAFKRHTIYAVAGIVLLYLVSPQHSMAAEFLCDTSSDELCTLSIAPENGAALALRAKGTQFNLNVDATGFEISGDVRLLGDTSSDTAGADGYLITEAALVAEYADPSQPDAGFRRLHGSAVMAVGAGADASPGLGQLQADAGFSRRMNVGIELGSILQEELHIAYLKPDRPCQGKNADDPDFRECPYWFFQYVEEVGAQLGFGGTDVGLNLTADASRENKVLFVMDPDDFFIYTGFTFGALDSVKLRLESTHAQPDAERPDASVDYGIGFSQSGYIPFEIKTTYGIEHYVDELQANFDGHMVMNGASLPIPYFPIVTVDGNMVLRLPIDEVSGEASLDTFQLASNGVFDLNLSIFGSPFSFTTQIANASAGMRIDEQQQSIYITGEAGKEFPWKPEALPLDLDANLTYKKVVVLVNNVDPDTLVPYIDVTDSFTQTEGEFLIDLSFGNSNGMIGGDTYARGLVRNHMVEGYTFQGNMGRGGEATLLHPLLQAHGDVSVTMHYNFIDVYDQLFELRGLFTAGSGSFAQEGILSVSPHGAYVGFPLSFDPSKVQQAYEDLQDGTQEAEAEVTRLNAVVAEQRSIVQAERNQQQATLASAQADLDAAQAEVNRLNSLINTYNSNISYYKSRIGSWYRWYKKQPWYKRASAYARYVSKKAYYNGLIASRKAAIVATQAAKGAATLALNVAATSVNVAKAAVVTTPIDLDPRVGPVILARDAALAVLNGLQSIMPDIPTIPGTITATAGFRLDGGGLVPETRAEYCTIQECVEIRGGTFDEDAGRACIHLPEEGNPQVCTVVTRQI